MMSPSRPIWLWKCLGLFMSLFVVLFLFYSGMGGRTRLHTAKPIRVQKVRLKFLAANRWTSNRTMRIFGKLQNKRYMTEVISEMTNKNQINTTFDFKTIKVQDINCKALIDGSEKEVLKAINYLKYGYRSTISTTWYFVHTKNCDNFVEERGYITDSLTTVEREFPIAYSILMFKDVEQFERLLRSIYRPQNYYCIHVDSKADEYIYGAIRGIAGCFDNVFLTRKSIDVQWGTFSVLEPELICMEMLFKFKKWKYFINLTGQEFPLKTNYELVKILKAYNGSNDLEATLKRANKSRWSRVGIPPPHNIRPIKGSAHIVVNRDFIDYVLHNQTAKDFLHWTKQIDVPDETFFPTLNHNPQLGIPGSYKGIPETNSTSKPFLARFKNWGNGPFNWPCKGKRIRLICVFGLGDLPLLASRREMFANKFYSDYEHYALDCMEELNFNKTRDEYLGKLSFNDSYYKHLDFVTNKV